eukprot:Nk52_evm56s78 gene=Nk52_evmTU56s78
MEDAEDLESFLEKVNNLDKIVKGLKAGELDPENVPDDLEDVVDVNALKHGSSKKQKKSSPKIDIGSKERQSLLAFPKPEGDSENICPPVAKQLKVPSKTNVTNVIDIPNEEEVEKTAASAASKVRGLNSEGLIDYSGFANVEVPQFEDEDVPRPNVAPGSEADKFMNDLETQSEERKRKQKELLTKAEGLKEQGNDSYKRGKYYDAINYYNQAIAKTPQASYFTNRAQAFLKVGKLDNVLQDSEKAIELDPMFVKAYVKKSIVYREKRMYAEALTALQEALDKKLKPSDREEVEKCVKEIQKEKTVLEEEMRILSLGEKDKKWSSEIEAIIKELQTSDKPPSVLIQSIEKLGNLLNSHDAKVLFRLRGGFDLVKCNHILKKHLSLFTDKPEKSSDEVYVLEYMFCREFLNLLKHVCDNENLNSLHMAKNSLWVCEMLETLHNIPEREFERKVQEDFVELLVAISRAFKDVRKQLVKSKKITATVCDVFMEGLSDDSYPDIRAKVMEFIGILAAEHELSHLWLSKQCKAETGLLCRIHQIMKSCVYKDDKSEKAGAKMSVQQISHLEICLSALCNISMSSSLRDLLVKKTYLELYITVAGQLGNSLFKSGSNANNSKKVSVLVTLLGFLMNLSLQPKCRSLLASEGNITSLGRIIVGLKGNNLIMERAVGLLSRLCNDSKTVPVIYETDGLVEEMLSMISTVKGEDSAAKDPLTDYLLRCIAACSLKEDFVSKLEALSEPEIFVDLMAKGSRGISTNSVLIVSNIVTKRSLCERLLAKDPIPLLIDFAKLDPCPLQKNAAICLARIAKSNPETLPQIRELRGIEILHSRMSAQSL